jgi:hypothetical protein
MRILASILSLALCLASFAPSVRGGVLADNNPKSGVGSTNSDKSALARTFVVGISPFLNSSVKDTVYRRLVQLIIEDVPLDSRVEIFDAYNLQSIAQVSIPNLKVFQSPKTRANQFASAIGGIRQFLARDNPKPAGPKPGFEGAIRLPQFFDFLSQNPPRAEGASALPLLLIGSPLYQDSKEPDFSMAGGYYPSDGHLLASRAESVFGLNPGENNAAPWLVSWAYFGDPWESELHHEKVERFWALYFERRGASLASFSADLETAVRSSCSSASGMSAASRGWMADPLQTKPEMVRVNRAVPQVDWLTGESRSEIRPAPPSQFVGPLKIGIRWKENLDLDLYATPRPDADMLFFQHPRSEEGYYFKDHRASPGREYEFIEFETPVDIREARAFVNFYAGDCPGGPSGEVRIEYLGRIYTGSFSIEASEGNKGRSGPSQSRFWTRIPIPEILGLHNPDLRAANVTPAR